MAIVPESVNYHFTRKCNYSCGFCFHTATTSYVLPLEKAQAGLLKLKNAGMKKINFSGGEPFLYKEMLGKMVQYCKEELDLESVSIISNGSLVTEEWFKEYGKYVDIMGVSCDSFDSETNEQIGRKSRGGKKCHLQTFRFVRDLCATYGVLFKINTVVNAYNMAEDMWEGINELRPVRWKVFQCMLVPTENVGEGALRDAAKFVISDDNFERFIERHRRNLNRPEIIKPEPNSLMRKSYLILDIQMRFLDGDTMEPSKSILDVDVADALPGANFDEKRFLLRGGKFEWSKERNPLEW